MSLRPVATGAGGTTNATPVAGTTNATPAGTAWRGGAARWPALGAGGLLPGPPRAPLFLARAQNRAA
ncbi:MAG: hypothetical protein KC609_16510, partial [Myxococcales bacterium]|nr:hypothetical protein [Myxococcales bacterium]